MAYTYCTTSLMVRRRNPIKRNDVKGTRESMHANVLHGELTTLIVSPSDFSVLSYL